MKDEFLRQSQELADEFANPGSLQYRMLQLGFMPHDEENAKAILVSLLAETDDELDENYGLRRSELPQP